MKARVLLPCLVLVFTIISQCHAAELPVTRVALFTSGVGYFEREGTVEGNTTVELTFRAEQINDILKSLVLQDLGGGTIAPVTYAPQEPLARTLSSFSINISDSPGLTQLWERLRGSRVRVVADGRATEGTVFGAADQEEISIGKTRSREAVLSLLTEKGLVRFAVSRVRSIKVLDEKLAADLDKALAAIDQSRDTEHKPVTLSFQGEGERKVNVGYLLETPLWKTTYRLVLDEKEVFLQGWALVENTTDDDWSNVGLQLISGRPVSFTQNLYQPLYLPRPQVPVAVAPAARPRTYEGAMERRETEQADRGSLAGAGGYGGGGGGMGGARGPAGPQGPKGEVGMPGAPGMAAPAPAPRAAAKALRLDETGAAAMAQGGQVGTLFQYAISQAITIPRQHSAMIPIINQKIEGEKVSVYNQGADPKRPMNGIRLKNTSGLHLMAGAITVFAGDAYGGDALIEDIPPGDERLITYAMDLEVEVEPQAKSRPDTLQAAKIADGILTSTWKQRTETTYNVKNVAKEAKTVLVEHPLRDDWKLVEPKEADERTRSVYRFRVSVPAGETAKLLVAEETPRQQTFSLATENLATIKLFLAQPELNEKMRAALEPLVKMQGELTDLAAQRTEKETRIKEIEQEQGRIRSNMQQLDRNSELYKTYVAKLTKQEGDYDKLREEIVGLREKEAEKRKAISDYIAGLKVE